MYCVGVNFFVHRRQRAGPCLEETLMWSFGTSGFDIIPLNGGFVTAWTQVWFVSLILLTIQLSLKLNWFHR